MKKLLIILYLSPFFSLTLNAQVSQQWVKRYNTGFENYYVNSLAIDRLGNIFTAGTSEGIDTELDYIIIKYNSNGDTLWSRSYNGLDSSDDVSKSVCVDNLCNVYITGESSEGMTTVKYDSAGNFKWVRSYNEINLIYCTGISVLADNSGNVYVLGSIWGSAATKSGYITIKYDSLGNTTWIQRYGNSIGGDATALALDSFGNIYVTGYMYFVNDDYVTIKYNSNGDSLWVRRYNSNHYDHPTSIAVDQWGNCYVTGESGGTPFIWGAYKYTTIKYDAHGEVLWIQKYDGLGNDRDYAFAIAVDNSGNVFVTGESSGLNNSFDYATIKYNSNGDSLWVRRYNGQGNGNDIANSLFLDSQGNVFVTGTSDGIGSVTDIATIKYNSDGVQNWVARYNGSQNEDVNGTAVKLDSAGNIYVAGSSSFNQSTTDYLTIKYSQLTGVNPSSGSVPSEYQLFQNYPNPFNPSTLIKYELPEDGFVLIKIYDLTGKEINTLVNNFKSRGSHSVIFESRNLPSGVYFYKLESGNFADTKRMILIK